MVIRYQRRLADCCPINQLILPHEVALRVVRRERERGTEGLEQLLEKEAEEKTRPNGVG